MIGEEANRQAKEREYT
jgi:hypothetical protein